MESISERVDKLIEEGKPLQVRLENKWLDFDGEIHELLKFHRSDIREKPEKEFIIGDWCIPFDGAKPVKLTEINIIYYNGTKGFIQYRKAKLWRPKKDDWCWFWNIYMTTPIIGQFDSKSEDDTFKSRDFNGGTIYWKNCEPYLGELPSLMVKNEY